MKKPITKAEIQIYISSRVRIDPITECWIWPRLSKRSGYGLVDTETRAFKLCKTELVHRISFIVYKSDLETGLVVRHRCNNRSCCNPDHLQPGTIQDNHNDRKQPLSEMSLASLLHLQKLLPLALEAKITHLKQAYDQRLEAIATELKQRTPG